MLIKYQALASHLQRKTHPVYVLIGQEHYLLNDAAFMIKKAWRQKGECDETTLHLNSTADWNLLLDEANSYSLFSEWVLLDARHDKKSIDAAAKQIMTRYLQEINPRCLIVLRAPNVPAKQLQWLANHEHVLVVQAFPLTAAALKNWITSQLKSHSLQFEQEISGLIQQYGEGNMLACAQVVEKLALVCDEGMVLNKQDVLAQLIDQSDYQLYELADACLAANGEKAIHLLRQACVQKTEPTLILWLLAQEIRLLIQLSHKLKLSPAFNNACSELKIWPQRAPLYQKTLARLPVTKLYHLLEVCKELDGKIKSNKNHQLWNSFEQLALSLC